MKNLNLRKMLAVASIIIGSAFSTVKAQSFNQDSAGWKPVTRTSCLPSSFIDSYAKHTEDDVFFIKGEVLEVIHHGNRIKIMEDLNGNFKEDSTFIVWGQGGISGRLDWLSGNKVNDTLLVLMQKTDLLENILCPQCEQYEQPGDFMTFECYYSVLKLSNGYVSGRLINALQDTTMLWSELLKILEKKEVNAFEADSAVWTYVGFGRDNEYLGTKTFRMENSIIIDGKKWKILERDDLFYTDNIPLVRLEGQKVFYLLNIGGFKTVLYDFSLNMGDSLEIIEEYRIIHKIDTSYYKVEEVDSIISCETKRKTVKLSYFYHAADGIGNLSYGLYSYLEPFPAGDDFRYYLANCRADGKIIYYDPEYSDENGNIIVSNEIIGGISQKAKVSHINGQLRVVFEGDAPFDIAVYDMRGMLLLQSKSNHNEKILSTNRLSKGIYIVRVMSDGYFCSEKIVK